MPYPSSPLDREDRLNFPAWADAIFGDSMLESSRTEDRPSLADLVDSDFGVDLSELVEQEENLVKNLTEEEELVCQVCPSAPSLDQARFSLLICGPLSQLLGVL